MTDREMMKVGREIYARERREKELIDFASRLTTVDTIERTETEWLVPYWIPKGEITLLAGDGGVGKTSLWCRIVSDISLGLPCFLENPDEAQAKENQKCMFFSSEDNISSRLKEMFSNDSAYEKNLLTMERTVENLEYLKRLKLNSDELKILIMAHRPAICVFDPIQAFLPAGMNMNSRNGIRSCMEVLSALGKNFGTAFLLVCHTNKRDGVSGRNRISNSSDLWDAARSVIMMGKTDIRLENHPEIRYISNEKNNYAPLQPTILFSAGEKGQLQFEGLSARREAEFLRKSRKKEAASSRLQACQDSILALLVEAGSDGMKTSELDGFLAEDGFSATTVKRAKTALKAAGRIGFSRVGFGAGSKHFTRLADKKGAAS